MTDVIPLPELIENLLREDIKNATAGDHDEYTRRVDALGKTFLSEDINYTIAQHVYQTAVNVAENEQKPMGGPLHKGLLYANLAVSKIAQGNIDSAVPDLFNAYEEDKRTYGVPDTDPWASPAFSQILKRYLLDGIYNYVAVIISPFTTTAMPAPSILFQQLGVERAVSLVLHLKKYQTNRALVTKYKNSFSRTSILEALRQVAVIIEDDLPRYGATDKNLGKKIEKIFSGKNWWPDFWNDYRCNKVGAKDKTTISIDDQIGNAGSKNPPIGTPDEQQFQKSLVVFYAARNYTAHNTNWNCELTDSLADIALGRMLQVFLDIPKFK